MSAKNLLLLLLLLICCCSSRFSPLLLLLCFFFCLWSMNCPKKKPKSSERKRLARHSFVTFSLRRCVLHKNPKKKQKPKKKTWRTSLRDSGQWEGGVGVKTEHCGGWRCINFSNLPALRRMNFSSFLNNFCLRVFVLFFFVPSPPHFMSCCYFVFFWTAELCFFFSCFFRVFRVAKLSQSYEDIIDIVAARLVEFKELIRSAIVRIHA